MTLQQNLQTINFTITVLTASKIFCVIIAIFSYNKNLSHE